MSQQPSTSQGHQCPTCGRIFQLEGNLVLHVDRMHSGAKAYICTWPDCEKRFSSAELLRKHLRNTHQPSKIKCSKCESTYSTNSALRRHERIHSSTRRYICSRCSAGFDLSEPYKIHLRQHDHIQPYACSVCSKTFTSRAVCRRHRAGHEKHSES
ncbi:unnamed protein product [Cylicocyclus nassatus]|uniref:C2H2-type domain-containing protein n=1 Tax=Cylicocyclus nassatus TaxID=53992 RepID=A0AA36M8P2_CYLNA|nr:unnamed protein product [Cylicocyclus nassatus]